MSLLVGTGKNNIIFYGLYAISSTLGFLILFGLLHIFYLNPFAIASWWYKGLLLVICMLASVFLFGGLVVGMWHLWGQNATKEECEDDEVDRNNENAAHKDSSQQNLASSTNTYYGSRPDFKGMSL
jgi:ferric-chelate reductase